MWVFLNDRFVPERDAKVSVFDHGFLYGDGLFETFRAYDGRIFALSQHLRRFSISARQLQLSIPSLSFLEARLNESLEKNALNNAILRLTMTRGENRHPLRPDLCETSTLVITVRSFSGLPEALYRDGVSADIVNTRRATPVGAGPFIKSLNFLNNILAKLEINPEQTFEGIFLNQEGMLSEGTTSNLFWISQGVLQTPSTDATILAGVTRDIILSLAEKEGLVIEEGLYPPKTLLSAEEAFLSNTGIELIPLVQVSGKKIGSGKPGPVTQKLHETFKNAVVNETGGGK
ncbi:MAG: aminotransferase class IV [Nitrospiria bacterium]